MEENNLEPKSISKYVWVVLSILIVIGVVYLVFLKSLETKPKAVLTPDSYPKGTTVSLYDSTPPDFPKEVVLEDKTLKYSGTVTNPQGGKQITVSYVSDKSMKDIVAMYETLPNIGWNITEKSVYEKVSIIKATKGEQSILISIAPLQEAETMVTFQFEK